MPSPVPAFLRPLLRPRASRSAASRALDRHSPDAFRGGLTAAVLEEPAGARRAAALLRREAAARGDRAAAARFRHLEARAIHRSGRAGDAVSAYAESEGAFRAAGLPDEALRAAVDRVDALATAGRVDAAVVLADRLAPRAAASSSFVRASLAVNRANALRLRGRLEEAIAGYEEAEAALSAAGSRYGAAVARLNAGVARMEGGDLERARDLFETAAATFAAEFPALALEARAHVAWAQAHQGELGSAVRELASLAQAHAAAGLGRRAGLCRLDLADALRRAGDVASAEEEALAAAADFAAADAHAERAEALWLGAATASAPDEARRRLREARRAASRAGRPAVALRCELLTLDLAGREGRPPPAAAFDALAIRAARAGLPSLADEAALAAAASALDAGSRADARRRFERVLRAARGRPWTRVAAETGLARLDGASPARRGAALARLRRVAAFLDAVGADLPGAWLRASFTAERLDPHLQRVELLLARGRPADRREAEALLDALGARRFLGARLPSPTPELASARRRLESIYDRLTRVDGARGADEADLAPRLVDRARAIERTVADAWRRAERTGPVAAATATPSHTELPRSAAVVHLWRRGDELRALCRVGDDVGSAVALGSVGALQADVDALRMLARRWASCRHGGGPADDGRAADRVLEALSDRLLAPLGVASWPAKVFLVAAPDAVDLPWELLPIEGRRLGESRSTLRVPSASLEATRRTAGRGTTVVAAADAGLPAVAAELASIRATLPDAQVVAGPGATRRLALDALAGSATVHFAGHGWDASEAPALAGVRLADGWLSASDLPPRIGADLVVLSACRTGRPGGRASLAWGGLVPALLAAGARRVVWAVDDVDDEAAALLMARFHEERRSLGDDAAFGRALARAATELGNAAAVGAFRISGVRT